MRSRPKPRQLDLPYLEEVCSLSRRTPKLELLGRLQTKPRVETWVDFQWLPFGGNLLPLCLGQFRLAFHKLCSRQAFVSDTDAHSSAGGTYCLAGAGGVEGIPFFLKMSRRVQNRQASKTHGSKEKQKGQNGQRETVTNHVGSGPVSSRVWLFLLLGAGILFFLVG